MANNQPFTNLKAFLLSEKAFFKNIYTMFGGKLYVAIVGILLTPVLARLFSPQNYAAYALFYAAVQHLVIIGTLSLPIAVSTSQKEELPATFNLALLSILIFTGITPFILYPVAPLLDTYFTTSLFTCYWPLIITSYLLSSLLALIIALNIRLKRFKQNTMAGVGEATSSKLTNLSTGWLGYGSVGLILGDLASKLITLVILLKTFSKGIKVALPSPKKAITKLKKLKHFPTYIMPSEWIGMLNNQLMLLVVAFLFSKTELGQLVMAIALLSIPLNILTNTFQPVITERLTTYVGTNKSYSFFTQTIILLTLISIFVFSVFVVIPSQAFVFFLGNQWVGIGTIINALAILYFFLLIDRSFENGFVVLGKQKAVLYFSIFELIGQVLSVTLAFVAAMSFIEVITLIVAVRSLVGILRVVCLFKSFS